MKNHSNHNLLQEIAYPLPIYTGTAYQVLYQSNFQLACPRQLFRPTSRLFSRGGVEDTRLEAKDTKKIRGQGAKDSFSEDRHSRGQGQECSRPRPRTKDMLSKKKKKGLHKNFSGDLQKKKNNKGLHKNFSEISSKNVFQTIFQALHKILNIPKNSAVLEPRTGQFSRT